MTSPAERPANRTYGAPRAQPKRRGSPPELDHRVANSLQLAIDFLLFQQARLSEPAARRALIEAAERLVAVGHLHRFLCAHEGVHDVDLKGFIEALSALIAQSTGLTCVAEVEPLRIPAGEAQQIGLLVNELAINAVKHAYPQGQPGCFLVRAHRQRDQLRLSVADRGAGLPPGFDPAAGDGLGLDIVRRIARQLNGRLHAESDGGARFTLLLPLATAAQPIRSFAPPG